MLCSNNYFLVRHAPAQNNERNFLSSSKTQEQFGITQQGEEKIENLFKLFSKENKIDLIVTSPYRRCLQTAKIANKFFGVPIEEDFNLREIEFGEFEGKTPDEYHEYFRNLGGGVDIVLPGGESRLMVRSRMEKAFDTLEEKFKNKNILIISHGEPLRQLLAAKGTSTSDDPRQGTIIPLPCENNK